MSATDDPPTLEKSFVPAPIPSVEITSPFWSARQECMRHATLPAILKSLRETGRAYALKWSMDTAPVKPHPFWDSDLYKVLEACCYYLMKEEDPVLREYVDESVKIIQGAQYEDGYINSFFTVLHPDKRFTNLRDLHELYCLGHLCEAAVSHRRLTGTDDLVAPTMKFVRLVASLFGTEKGKRRGYPGHQELEIGLMRLYELTGDKTCLELAGYFILERGKTYDGQYYFDIEARARGGDPEDTWSVEFRPWFHRPRDYAYNQAHKPLLEQETIEGHSVRAMYYLIAATDYAAAAHDPSVLSAVKRLYHNTTHQKMYVTGGIGSIERSEGFTANYWLPDQEEGGCAYSETCASFALIVLSQRLLQVELRGEYGDVMETALCNTVLGAVGTDGLAFYYQNPLATYAGHGKPRSTWFEVACCPPNVAKILGMLPELTYSQSTDSFTICVHLFLTSTFTTMVNGKKVVVTQKTDMPWNGDVEITIDSETPIALNVRVPRWAAKTYKLSGASGELIDGYFHIPSTTYTPSTPLKFSFPCIPRKIFANPRTRKDEVALARGPLVYCAENVDNPSLLLDVFGLSKGAPLTELEPRTIAGIDGVRPIRSFGRMKDMRWWEETDELYDGEEEHVEWMGKEEEVTFVPYFLRQNRGGNGEMRVWVKRVEANMG